MRPVGLVAVAGLLASALAGALTLRPGPHVAADPVLPSSQVAREATRTHAVVARQHRAYPHSRAVRATAARAHPARHTEAIRVAPATPVESPIARGQRIYTSLHYDVRALDYRLVVEPSVRGLLGLTDPATRTITVYVRSSESDLVLAHSIAHEIGHAVDLARGSAAERQLYLTIRQLPNQEWYGCPDCTDYATPAGDWAEVFAQWLAGPGDFRGTMAGPPSAAQLSLLEPLFTLSSR